MRKYMKKLFCLLVVFILVSCGTEKNENITSGTSNETSKETSIINITPQSIISNMGKGKYKDGELLVKFKSGIISTSSLRLHRAVGASVMKRFNIMPDLEHVKLPKGLSVKDAILQYMSDPNVEYAEPNYMMHIVQIPNDQYFSQQWALLNTGQFANSTPNADISAPKAWDISTGSRDIIIAVIDSGIDYSHPDFVSNMWTNSGETNCFDGIDNDGDGYIDDCKGWNFFSNTNDPVDDNEHGTHVAGIIGAVGNNSIGITGVMWNVKLMPLKIFGADGTSDTAKEIAAIDYAISLKNRGENIKVINASFSRSGDFSIPEQQAIASANTAGLLFVTAAGNGGGSFCDDGDANNNDVSPCYPANYNLPNIISVAATDRNDRLASFSNFGSSSVHVAAPGAFILSTVPTSILLNGYDFLYGTSMATAHVSGLAGLLYSYYNSFNLSQIRGMIMRYVDEKTALESGIYSKGRIDAYKAMSSLLTPENLAATSMSPSQINLSWSDKATGEDGYKIGRKIAGGSYSLLTTLPEGSESYQDNNGLIDGTKYYYRVWAYNTIPADSQYLETSATTSLSPPTGLTATAISSSEVNLIWKNNSKSEDGYKIERSISGDDYVVIRQLYGQSITTFNDSGLNPSTTYYYKVIAFNSIAPDSLSSNVASVTTLSTTGESNGGGGGGRGGGCSIGTKQKTPAAFADLAALLLPLIFVAVLRRRV
jgi:subtilisin family serine protease